jgi:hypothetical protein
MNGWWITMFTLRLKQNHAIIILTGVYCILNSIDAASTLWGINLGLITEANPLMRLLLAIGPLVFLAVKLTLPVLVGLFCWFIRYKRPWLSVFVLWLAVAVYSLVTLLHFYWVAQAMSVLGFIT